MSTQPQKMDEADWKALGAKLFGADLDRWAFVCPHCGNVMSIAKARELSDVEVATLRRGWRMEQECVGRYLSTAGCDWAAYGLFSGPFFVVRGGGDTTPVFGFAIPTEAA